MKALIPILLSIIAASSLAAAEDVEEEQLGINNSAYDNPTTSEERKLTFNFEQNVSGSGFFSAYKYAHMPDDTGTEGWLFNGVESKNRAHGSGHIDTDSTIYAESSYSNKTWINGAYDEDGEEIEDEEEATSLIRLKDDSRMTYSPALMAIGSRYYDRYPIAFSSLLKDENGIKNRNGLNSLDHLVEQAHGLKKLLDAQSDGTINAMNIEEDVIDGHIRFGVFQLAGIPRDEETEEESEETQVLGLAMKAWKKAEIDMDEDYRGSFHIERNASLITDSDDDEKEDSWLPCCFRGFNGMNYTDAKAFKSSAGIFDCTCFQVPSRAQFQR